MDDRSDDERSGRASDDVAKDDAAEVDPDGAEAAGSSAPSRSTRLANPALARPGLAPGLLDSVARTLRRQDALITGSQNALNSVVAAFREQEALIAPALRHMRSIDQYRRSVIGPTLLPGVISWAQQAVDVHEQVKRSMNPGLVASLLAIETSLSEALRQITLRLPSREQIERLALPPNLRPSDVFYDPDVYATWIIEGLPLAYVLDGDIINTLSTTDSPQERRILIGRRRDRIVARCENLLNEIAAAHVQPFVENARLAIAGLRAGHHQLAQTWASANLESLVKEFDGQRWSAMLDEKQPAPKLFRSFFFVGQVRALMRRVHAGAVPRELNRHASVHHTTARRQFSKLNATLAIAHLVSAICNYDAAARVATAQRG